jgi:SRSO17 transposase
VSTSEDQVVAAGRSVDARRWSDETDRLLDRLAARLPRVETRRRVRGFVLGLLADLPRKNCWSIAEHAGDRDPHGMQYLLAQASWDTDGVRDDLREYVVGALGDTDAMLVFDETGDLKKGTCTLGGAAPVHRHRRADRERPSRGLPNLRRSPRAHPMIDRELYLPQSWIADPQRLTDAGVPDDI